MSPVTRASGASNVGSWRKSRPPPGQFCCNSRPYGKFHSGCMLSFYLLCILGLLFSTLWKLRSSARAGCRSLHRTIQPLRPIFLFKPPHSRRRWILDLQPMR